MGDSARFRLMADAIEAGIPKLSRIADVAGGKGQLQAELYRRGYRNVVSWDTRRKYSGPRRIYRNGLFDYRSAPRDYDVVVGMHPDQATDHIVAYAVKHNVPFVVCPCCILPSAKPFEAVGFAAWIDHLASLASSGGLSVKRTALPMSGRNILLEGRAP